MIQRFHIEDLITQDASGVTFRALDTETKAIVAVRRFFPFGADGGGLEENEQSAYHTAVQQLTALSHPGLRTTICGGCDPVDRIPFIATEWIEGKTLQNHIEAEPLKAAEAIQVLTLALEICELLSRTLGEEGAWLETDLRTVILGGKNSGRGVTFRISPLKWLGRRQGHRELESLAYLTEELMGWQGQAVGDQAGRGLGAWLNWLHASSKTASLHEAREMLTKTTGMQPPPSATKNLVPQAPRPTVPIKSVKRRKKSINGTLVTIIVLLLVTAGLGGWAMYRKDPYAPKPKAGSTALAAETTAKPETATLTKTTLPAPSPAVGESSSDETAPEVAVQTKQTERPVKDSPAPAAAAGGVFASNDPEIVRQEGNDVVVAGVFERIDYSRSKKTMYLHFSKRPEKDDTRGAVLISSAGPDLSESALTPLIGKKIRLRGKLVVQKESGLQRPDVTIANRTAIEVIENE